MFIRRGLFISGPCLEHEAWFKGTVGIIPSEPQSTCEMAMFDSLQYPWNLYLIKYVKDIVVFLGFKVLISDSSFIFSAVQMRKSLLKKPQLKIISFQTLKGAVVNRAFLSLQVTWNYAFIPLRSLKLWLYSAEIGL